MPSHGTVIVKGPLGTDGQAPLVLTIQRIWCDLVCVDVGTGTIRRCGQTAPDDPHRLTLSIPDDVIGYLHVAFSCPCLPSRTAPPCLSSPTQLMEKLHASRQLEAGGKETPVVEYGQHVQRGDRGSLCVSPNWRLMANGC